MTLQERRDILHAAQNDLWGEEVEKGTGRLVRFSYRKRFNDACAADPVFCISACFWIFDPEAREDGDISTNTYAEMPFLLRELQEEYITNLRHAIDTGYDLLTEKSRSMGATWCVLALFIWYWLFRPNSTFLIGSLNRDKTDKKGDNATLFGKLDFLIDMLAVDAWWLVPEGYVSDKPTRTYLKMLNPVNGSAITGEAPGENFGRSGRYMAAFLDEFAAWPFGKASWTSCSLTARCLLPVSTPHGMSNQFGRLANPPKGQKGIRKFRMYWKDDPTKNFWTKNDNPDAPWYNGPEREDELIQPWHEFYRHKYNYDDSEIAQEIEISYGRSVKGQIYFSFHLVIRGIYDYNPGLPLYSAWDFGFRDFMAIIWIQYNRFQNEHRVIDSFQFAERPVEWYVPFILGTNLALGDKWGGYNSDQVKIIERHEGWQYADHYGDPSGKNVELVSARSAIKDLMDHGIKVRTNSKANHFRERLNLSRKLLTRTVVDERYNDEFIEAMENYRFPEQTENTQSTDPKDKPVHDEYSHFATAFQYYSVNQKNSVAFAQTRIAAPAPQQPRVVFGNQQLWDQLMEEQKQGRGIRAEENIRRGGPGYRR